MAAKKNNKIIIIIVVLLLAAALIAVIFLGKKAEEPAPVSADETLKESVQEDVEEFENGDKVVMDATGETYIEPEYSPDLVEVARQWASKVDRKFADDNDMVHEFMADDAYITYIIYGTLDPDEEPVQQQPQQQPQPQKPAQQPQQPQQGQQHQSSGGTSDGGATVDDMRAALGLGSDKGHTGADAGEIGDWELPDNVHIE